MLSNWDILNGEDGESNLRFSPNNSTLLMFLTLSRRHVVVFLLVLLRHLLPHLTQLLIEKSGLFLKIVEFNSICYREGGV